MKKIVIPLLILFYLMPANLFSQNTITLTIGTIQAAPGQLISIPISISGANGTNAIGVGQFYIFHTSGITKTGANVGFSYGSLTNPNEWQGNLEYDPTIISNTWMVSNFNDVSFPNGYVLFYINVYYNSTGTVPLTWGTSGLTETLVDNNFGTLYGSVNLNFINGAIIPAPPQPGVPNLLSPANNASGVSISPTLEWQASSNATSYQVQVSASNTFSTTLIDEQTTGTSRQLSNLSYSTTYYWRVRASNSSGTSAWSSVWSFTTQQAPLSVPVLLSPANNASGVSISPTLEWQASSNATSYQVQVSASNTFSTTLIDEQTTGTSRQLSNLSYSTTYYWRVRASNSNGTSAWSSVWSFTTLSIPLPDNWNYTNNTGNYAVIGLNPNGVYKIDDRNISNGDAIGVFCLDESVEKCAGYMIWNGQNFGIVVWGDDDYTQNTKEGFSSGETYIIKVWDAQTLSEHYADFNITSGLSTYQPNGITLIDTIRAIVKITHNISLNTGWNMISSYVLPDLLNISYLMSPISQKLQIMRNNYGLVYSPPFSSSLSQWNRFHAYQLRLSSQATLPIYGIKITPQALPIFLSTNWYWLPYPRTSSMSLTSALSSILNKILQVKSIYGQVYHPPFFNTLQTLEPGKGYMIKMIQGARLVYPANSATKTVTSKNSFIEPSVFIRKNHITGKTAVIPMEISNIQDGDEVGIFTRDGLLVGSSVWQEGSRGVVVWGNDDFTPEKDGAYEGEELIVKVWSRKDQAIGSLQIAETRNLSVGELQQTLRYETDAILMLKGVVEYETTSLTITPQPATEELFISYGELSGGTVEIELYNQNGGLLVRQVHNSPDSVIKLDISSIPSGVYFVVLRNGSFLANKRVVVVR